MEYRSVKGLSGISQFGILCVFWGLGFVASGFAQVSILSTAMPAGTSISDLATSLQKIMTDPKFAVQLQVAQVVGTFVLFFIPAVLFSLVVHGKNPFWLGFNTNFKPAQIALGFALIFLANICAGPLTDMSKSIVAHFPDLNALGKKLEDAYNQQVMAMSNLQTLPQYLLGLLIIAFFPAIFEEVLFRGVIQNLLVKWLRSPWAGILIASVLFSLIHGSVYLFFARVVLGIVLGLLFYYSKNIWVNIIAHFLNNAFAVTQLYYLNKIKGKIDIAQVDPAVPWWAGLLALTAIIVLLIYFKKISALPASITQTKEEKLLKMADPFFEHDNDITTA